MKISLQKWLFSHFLSTLDTGILFLPWISASWTPGMEVTNPWEQKLCIHNTSVQLLSQLFWFPLVLSTTFVFVIGAVSFLLILNNKIAFLQKWFVRYKDFVEGRLFDYTKTPSRYEWPLVPSSSFSSFISCCSVSFSIQFSCWCYKTLPRHRSVYHLCLTQHPLPHWFPCHQRLCCKSFIIPDAL